MSKAIFSPFFKKNYSGAGVEAAKKLHSISSTDVCQLLCPVRGRGKRVFL
jgi:hypothetical protein